MSEPFYGQVSIFGFNYAPVDWAFCRGQLMSVQQNTALFSLLGTNFGGDGRTTFGVPNLQGTVPVGQGRSSAGTDYAMGEVGGTTSVTLTLSTIPPHNHALNATGDTGTTETVAANTIFAHPPSTGGARGYSVVAYNSGAPDTTLSAASISSVSGGGLAHNNIQPFVALNWCISLSGLYPPRP